MNSRLPLSTRQQSGFATSKPAPSPHRTPAAAARVRRRQLAEKLFKNCGALALGVGLLFVIALFASIISNGYSAFWQSRLRLDVDFSAAELGLTSSSPTPQQLDAADYAAVIRAALSRQFPEVVERRERRELAALVSSGAPFVLRDLVQAEPGIIGSQRSLWLVADDDVDMFLKGNIARSTPEAERKVKDRQIAWLDRLQAQGRIERHFNTDLFTS